MQKPVNKRISSIIDYLKISHTKFANQIGVPQTTLATLFIRDSEPKFDLIYRILDKYPFISTEWLVKGAGEMISGEPKSYSVDNEIENQTILRQAKRISELEAQIEELQKTTVRDYNSVLMESLAKEASELSKEVEELKGENAYLKSELIKYKNQRNIG